MEEIDNAVGVTATASSKPANANPNAGLAKNPSSKVREEGELSSSDDEAAENPVCSAAPSVGTVVPPAGPISVRPVNKGTQGIQTGNPISGNYSASSIDIQSRTSIQPIPHKSFNKKRVPLKSATRGWRPPLGPNNDNLVIRFSDDDSGSDSEEHRLVKALETKGNSTVGEGNRRVPVPSLEKSNKLRQTARNENKVMPKNLSLSRMFTTPMTTIQGANSRGAGPSLIDQGSRSSNFNTLNKNLGSRERGCDQDVGLNNTKLQDLRQQIALRESELKQKSAQQNKESSSVSCRDYNAMNQNNDTARKLSGAAADLVQLDLKEPDKKRLKVSGSLSTQPSSGGQREMPAAKSTLPSKGPALESISLQDWNKAASIQRGISLGRAESSIVKWKRQDDKRFAVSLESIPSRAKDGADINTGRNQSDRSSRQSSVELNHPSKTGGHQPPGYLLNKATAQDNLIGGSDHHEVIPRDKTLEPSFKTCQGPVNNGSLWNYLGNANVSENSNIKLQSLIEMEESLEKDLEEAQEHRHRCEIEERNALKAYRKAQRALVEANARCTDLYRRREHYSTHFRSYIMENSSVFCSSMQHEHVGVGLNYSNNISENVSLIPTSSHHMQPECDGSNIQCVNNAPSNTTHWHVRGHSLGSEPCSEPDASTSEPLPHRSKNTAEGTWSPSNDPNPSADEDEETFAFEVESIQPNIEYHIKEKNLENGQDDISNETNKKVLVDSSQDTLLLEATLRSELFARLGTKTLSQNSGSCDNTGHGVERGAKNDVGREKTQIGNGTFPRAEKYKQSDLGGTDRQERSIFETTREIQNQSQTEKFSLNSHSTADSQDCGLSTRQDHHLPTSVSSSSLIFRSAFGHLKVMSPISVIELRTKNQLEDRACVNSDEILRINAIANTIKDLSGKEFGSYTCSPAVDPFWPLCMYELRGKCNNDECPWQHFRDHSNGNMYQQQHDDSDSADSQQICSRATKGPKYFDVMTSPTYLVGLDMLRADPRSYESVLARRSSQWWQKSFSSFLAVSKMLRKAFPADGPFLHGTGGRIEIHGNWNRKASYFQSRNGVLNQLEQALADNDQSLEMALIILNQEVNNLEGVKKALDVLSRALETDPTSVTLWIFYLLIYYSNTISVGKDDMFSHAVKLNEGSYELWLIYINSRTHLDDRLVAYDSALKALCSRASDSKDGMHASACILDLFLQMMGCLCMSGNVEKAIQRSYGVFPASTNSNELHSLSLSDILVCLTLSHKCVFWVCCVYLVIYRKLPDAVVQRFECEKELLEIEWPSINLIDDEKQRARELMEAAVDSVDSYIYNESQKSEINLRSAQLFAVNHIMCMVALDSLECVRNLLDKYIKSYPSCLELVLISARTPKHDFGDLSFEGFEEALSQWRKEVPGIQCIWNQYVEYALQNGRLDVAKEFLVHWFHSVWKVQYLQNGLVEPMNGGNSCHSLALASKSSPETTKFDPNQIDLMFGYLNLSLHKLLQNDHIEARSAIDKAMKAATPEYFKHCLKEHATFLLTNESLSKEDPPIIEIKNVLEGYLADASAFLISEPLSRKFIDDIKKSRVQQLVSNIFSPVSFDFSLVNSILEVWYGPTLLTQKFSDSKNLVDFVESILEILPSNYLLAISLCKLLSREYNSTNVTCASLLFWGSSTLVSAIFHAIPIPPEYVWVEAAGILGNLAGIEAICERFYERAFSVYPFSVKLWKSYYNLSKAIGNTSTVVEAAKKKGIELDELQF